MQYAFQISLNMHLSALNRVSALFSNQQAYKIRKLAITAILFIFACFYVMRAMSISFFFLTKLVRLIYNNILPIYFIIRCKKMRIA